MSASGSDFDPEPSSREPSVEPENNVAPDVAPAPSRKRRRPSRSSSLELESDAASDSISNVRYHLQGHYKDEYRTLYNELVDSAAAGINTDDLFQPRPAQIGASIWSTQEKKLYFAALERLGSDDLPVIAGAIGTKSVPEVRHFSLLLQDASVKQDKPKVTLRDIPAAAEISNGCTERLELAGDALAWYQERFEAKREQEQFGNYWLITPEIAEGIENAQTPSHRQSIASSVPRGSGDDDDPKHPNDNVSLPQILQNVPEVNLLVPANFLKLSSTIFMNPSPKMPASHPHWSTLVSPLASKPSIYRTALIDFHTLAISLTRRLVQASIIQATSRIRSQGWRVKKGVNPLLKKRDVITAVDMLRVERNGRERWKGAARRCGLRVFEGAGKQRRVMNWNEVEEALTVTEKFTDGMTTDEETPEPTSEAADNGFKSRAARSGTPLPSRESQIEFESEHEEGTDGEYDHEGSDADELPSSSDPLDTSSPIDEVDETDILEAIDYNASREEELRLWGILGDLPPSTLADAAKIDENRADKMKQETVEDDWRNWTDYRADWENVDEPVSPSEFQANQQSPSPAPLPSLEDDDAGRSAGSRFSSDAETQSGRRLRKRRKVTQTEIPIRGARAYAAMQDMRSGSEGRDSSAEGVPDDADWPAPSIEVGGFGMDGAMSHSADDMET